ncbi:MAG: bifunctional phosphopantothenoylcysteine decarboxylase/phosphopantothenate--cysteine ligase CoaBC [Methanosarcinaceae archaeon]|nr:bifunctional phosphopantothenoylcysteine decarboxylase/phosphopantothenate--cysteine ligase CoaBC [Methanosarcinaceae archaeon]MDD4331822.1 bifunctional phosphopantothenoylcysteine decarboxylase/phosphopantothenate--cysteine ligase CoaBC [Methanosarcinaceae archaeon]MDD4748782.1 bifunctional phosphopantothenoylcysteine decarboxylase/phosphopantothenate--cysteine ligase CoaBC [Methanosarcinaceae archaeon]
MSFPLKDSRAQPLRENRVNRAASKLSGTEKFDNKPPKFRVHPTLWIQGKKSSSLKGKTIVLGVTGSIAAVRVIELAREFIRNGAEVHAVMTEAAQRIIHPDALYYATGQPVIKELGGRVEHVEFCGLKGCADLLLIAPATANTLGKIATGIDDTPVTSFATTALGSNIPLLIVPAMHESMYKHPAVLENIRKLQSWGIGFVGPKFEEGVAKLASNADIVLEVERALGSRALAGKKILLTSGSTAESLDPIRIFTNRASGKTGFEIALEAYRRGAEVTLVHRQKLNIPGFRELFAESAAEMTAAVLEELKSGYDALISAAAIADFSPEPFSEKIKSGRELKLKLNPTRKLIKECRNRYPALTIIGFKAETEKEELLKRAWATLEESKLDMIAANDVSKGGMGTENNELYLLKREKEPRCIKGSKRELAGSILDELVKLL